MNDPNDKVACIARYLKKISPLQERFYCREASEQQKSLMAAKGFPNAQMAPKQRIGENYIADMIAEAARRSGLGNLKGQGLRRIMITTITNTEGISEKERLHSARHASVAAGITYQTRNTKSESAKFGAILGNK